MLSPTKYELSLGIQSLLSQDGDILQYAIDNFVDTDGVASGATFYANEDFSRLGQPKYPFVHVFGYSKESTSSSINYTLAVEVSVLRATRDANNRFVHDEVGNVIVEGIHGKMDTWVEMIKNQLRVDLATIGISGTKGFGIERIGDQTLPPIGQEDLLCYLELNIKLDKCL